MEDTGDPRQYVITIIAEQIVKMNRMLLFRKELMNNDRSIRQSDQTE